MLSRRKPLISFISYLTLLLVFVMLAESASAQSAVAEPIKATKSEAVSVETVPVPAGVKAVAMSAQADAANATADSVKAESAPASANAEPPKAQPSTSTTATTTTTTPQATPICTHNNTVKADVVALPQPIMLNRLGAAIPNGLVFALKRDLDANGRLRSSKRARPLVLRANVGDCLEITFTNNIKAPPPLPPANQTSEVSIHVQGMEWVNGSQDDGSFVGANNSSLATAPGANPPPSPARPQTRVYTLYAKAEGTYLLYTMGDTSTQGDQLLQGLFGAVNIQPTGAQWYRSQVTASDLQLATYNANDPSQVPAGSLTPAGCTNCNFKVKGQTIKVIKTPGGYLNTLDNHPLINYDAVYPAGAEWLDRTPIPPNTPVLKMLDANNNIVNSDLTAIITGPNAGRFPGAANDPNKREPPCNAENNPALNTGVKVNPLFCSNPAAPDRKQPYREITIIYHGGLGQIASQAFPIFNDPTPTSPNAPAGGVTLRAGQDAFAINYGTGGIGAEIYANRVGVGPMGDCVDCKYEEFFLSAWSVGDPAMLVDRPANSNQLDKQAVNTFKPPCNTTASFNTPPCGGTRVPGPNNTYVMQPKPKANVAFFPEDPSNVYHSYINDHVKFRILHGGVDVTHVHHQHAHQWLQSPNSDESSYLDSQMISPGASYTLEITYNGSGNRNKVVGDSIFHCHFYPHFAAGMWAMWRTHDVFESGTFVYPKGAVPPAQAFAGQVVPGSRALPDGEIVGGVPTPAVVPMPTIPMAPLPAYAQIQTKVNVNGAPIKLGGQVVIGGTCQNNKINGLDVIGGCTNGQQLNGTVINSQFNGTQMTGQFQPSAGNQLENPGYPYFIPGVAGARAPHPPFDFASDGAGGFLDGGLPRHVVIGGSVAYERHTTFDWSKDLATIDAIKLPEDGTDVEKTAIAFFSQRCRPTFFPDGTQGKCPSPSSDSDDPPTGFVLNGLPLGPQPGAPFADPAVDGDGKAVGIKRVYKAAAIQLNVTFNKKGWHFPQQRILTLWKDVLPTLPGGGRKPEPLFFRGNAGDIVEYWHTNLVPNYYLVDDFQVRTPTDILGQHIHLVKFDVTSSDGAANGFNYEDGTFSPQEVQEVINGINHSPSKGFINAKNVELKATLPPKDIIDCQPGSTDPRCNLCKENQQTLNPPSRPQCESWMGAQTTIQRWWLDPLLDNSGQDRTMRTAFTHDHFGPSTHQQAGLYAGLLIEPKDSIWRNAEDGTVMGRSATLPPMRSDGGPTSWKADILVKDKDNKDISYREFALEFQDFQLAYRLRSYPSEPAPITKANDDPKLGWRNKAYAINPPGIPQLISTAINPTPGTHSVNYLSEPLAWRVGNVADMSYAYDNAVAKTVLPTENPEPMTPLMRAYQNDNVQIRVLVGAHTFAHQFNLAGPTWLAEPFWKNSGYRSAQAMGLSEHFEFLFNVPSSSAPNLGRKCPDGTTDGNCVDYLYSPSLDEIGLANGMWGIFRAYDPNKPANKLQPLPNNTAAMNTDVSYSTCPTTLVAPAVKRVFNITAVTAQKALAVVSPVPGVNPPIGQIVFNKRGTKLHSSIGVMYVRTEDLDAQGRLKAGVPIEPLVLRANAGDCIEVNLTNALDPNAEVFKKKFFMAPPFDETTKGANPVPLFQSKMSVNVGLHPQLLSYDAAQDNGLNVGWNRQYPAQKDQVVSFGKTIKYQWYAGKIDRDNTGKLVHTPVEFGSLNLFPSDPLFQQINGLFGSMIIEPQGSTWKCGEPGNLADCDPSGGPPPTTRTSATVTPADGTKPFREFALMITDNMVISQSDPTNPNGSLNQNAVNYRTEPQSFRYLNFDTKDFSCMLSNQLKTAKQDPDTPIFTASVGDAVRFRMTHPFGTGTSQVFSLHGHVWQRNPYTNDSKVIGDQILSQWIGSRDNHGPSDHFELVLDKAGGENGRAGDYLYTVFVPQQAITGSWGLFRVLGPGGQGGPVIADPACTTAPPAPAAQPAKRDKRELERFIRPATNQENKKLKP